MKIFFLILVTINLSLASDVLIDNKTKLMWQDDNDAQYLEKNWEDAIAYCSTLELSGHDDWRLPVIKELLVVDDLGKDASGKQIVFKHIGGSGYYWSSSENEDYEAFAWMMNFKRSYKYVNYKTYERHIRCVRENKKGRLKETVK
jgi:hypothetical protein